MCVVILIVIPIRNIEFSVACGFCFRQALGLISSCGSVVLGTSDSNNQVLLFTFSFRLLMCKFVLLCGGTWKIKRRRAFIR